METQQIILTVDCVVFNERGELLVIKRGNDPFKGMFALPGGRVEYGESTESASLRELKEETGIDGVITRLIGVYSKPGRDPRGHAVSIAFLVTPKRGAVPVGGDDAVSARFVKEWETLSFGFDHMDIIRDAFR